ncbi:hypothetical protein [Flavobacterium sp. IMCC34518]|uniref:hypothetical protein n=1 Tax=Flavobacterium sp. IMCC34518 TaxID=3003623 RepID=UPI0022ABF346|nr:hypothetical protein [Flavobacterium sp. IMCC34518]
MTKEELRVQYPKIYQEILAEGMAKERQNPSTSKQQSELDHTIEVKKAFDFNIQLN